MRNIFIHLQSLINFGIFLLFITVTVPTNTRLAWQLSLCKPFLQLPVVKFNWLQKDEIEFAAQNAQLVQVEAQFEPATA